MWKFTYCVRTTRLGRRTKTPICVYCTYVASNTQFHDLAFRRYVEQAATNLVCNRVQVQGYRIADELSADWRFLYNGQPAFERKQPPHLWEASGWKDSRRDDTPPDDYDGRGWLNRHEYGQRQWFR